MAAQVEVQPGDLGMAAARGRLHLSPLTDVSIEIPSINPSHIITSEPSKPVPAPKPRLSPKPFSVEKNPSIKPILAPKPQTKSRPESTRLPEQTTEHLSTQNASQSFFAGTPRLMSTNPNRPSPTFFKTSNRVNTGQTIKPVGQAFKPAPPLDSEVPTKPSPLPSERQKPGVLRCSKSFKRFPVAEWSGTPQMDDDSKSGTSITRAKSMGFLLEVGKEDERSEKAQPEALVQLRPTPRSSRPRPVSSIFPVSPSKTEAPVPAPRWAVRRPLSTDLTSKFESIGLSLYQISPKEKPNDHVRENSQDGKLLPQRREQEQTTMRNMLSRSTDDSSDQSNKIIKQGAGKEAEEVKRLVNIKSRISLLLDSSSSPGGGSTSQVSDPQTSQEPAPEIETTVGIKQLIKQLNVDTTLTQSPVMKPTLKPRPLPFDLTKRFSSERSPDPFSLTEAAERYDISKDAQRRDEDLEITPNAQKPPVDFEEFQTFGDISHEHNAAVQTVRASLFDYFVEKQNVTVMDNGDIAKDLCGSLSFKRVDGEDERTLFTATNKESMSPSGPLQFLHAFETVQIGEENKTMNTSVPLAQLENKVMTIQSKRNRSLTEKMSLTGQLALSMTTEQQPRFLRVGALPKWTMSGLDQNYSIEKGMLKESEMETPMALDKDRDQQNVSEHGDITAAPKRLKMLPDEETPKPRATYFALTGQIQEPISLGDVGIAPIDITLPISGGQGKSLPTRRNPSLDQAFDKSFPVPVEEMIRSHLSARNKMEKEDFERIKQMALEQEMLRLRDFEKKNEKEMEHRLAINELAKKEKIETERKKRELQKQTERHLIKMKELEKEKQRQLEIEKQSHLEFARMKEMEMQREVERQRQKVFEKQKKEHERQKQAELEKLKLQEREKEKQTELEKHEKQKAHEIQKQIEFEKQRLQELEWEKQNKVQKERERQLESEKRREAERMLERERWFEKENQRQKEEERLKELDKERWLLEIQKEKQKMEELERIKKQERQQLLEFKRQKQAEKERQELFEYEKQRQREKKEREEAEKIKQMALEQEMLRMSELNKERERQRMMEIDHHKEMERNKQMMEQERQQHLELQKHKQREKERQQHIELEKEKLREKKEKQEAETIRRMVFEHEILKIKELEKQMEQQNELEKQRQKEIEKERRRELEQQRQRDLERERQRQLDFERQEMENQRLRQQEQQREKQRFEDLEKLKVLEKRQLMEFEKQKQADREREHILELENSRLKEKIEREEAEKMRQISRQQEAERQRLKEKQRKEEQERLKTSPLRPQVLDLDSVLRSDLKSKTTSPRSVLTTRWKEPYKPVIIDIDSFSSLSQHSPAQDLFTVPSDQGFETEFVAWLEPTPERDVTWKVPSQPSGGISSPMWTAAPQESWELQPLGMSGDKPIPEPRNHANNLGPEQLLLRQDDWLWHPQRLQDNPSQLAFFLGAEAKTAHSSDGRSISASLEHMGLPHELQRRDSIKDTQSQRRSLRSQELNRMRSRSVSRRSAPPDTLTEGNLSRVRSRSAHREQERHSWQKQSGGEESKDESRDSETAGGDTDSQYGTWETGLRTDNSLTSATPSSENKSTSPHTPGDAASQAEANTTDECPPPPSECQPHLFPDIPTALLDTSALRSRAHLVKKRAPRTRPSRATRQADAEGGGPEDWLYRDSTEATLENKEDESDSEEQAREADAGPAVSFQPQRVALFPGVDPLALKAQLKKRNDSDNQVDGPTSSPSQLSRSPKSPFLPRVARMLPSAGRKESGEEDSPQWLKELKSKKRLSQYENDSLVNN